MQKGYTIIETIMVITLLLIVMGVGVTSYSRFTQQRRLNQDVTAFVDILNVAKQKSINRDTPEQFCPSTSTFGGYQVSTNASSALYDLEILCSGVKRVQRYVLANSQLTGASLSITFLYPYGAVPGAAAAEQQVTFRNDRLSECVDVFINRLGVVRVGNTRPNC